jgi:hypothetical protein
LLEAELLGADAVDGRERAVEDVVDAVVAAGLFDGGDVGGLFDDADDALVARGVGAVGAGVDVGDVVAERAEAEVLLERGWMAARGAGVGV